MFPTPLGSWEQEAYWSFGPDLGSSLVLNGDSLQPRLKILILSNLEYPWGSSNFFQHKNMVEMHPGEAGGNGCLSSHQLCTWNFAMPLQAGLGFFSHCCWLMEKERVKSPTHPQRGNWGGAQLPGEGSRHLDLSHPGLWQNEADAPQVGLSQACILMCAF